MLYNDEKLLTIEEYEVMAKAYNQSLKDRGFIFVQIDGRDNEDLAIEIFEIFSKIKSLLFHLGNFLNTGRMFSLNERHIKTFLTLYPSLTTSSHKVRGDKTTCFLAFLGLESSLLSKLMLLSEQSPFSSQIDRIINQRLTLMSQLFAQQKMFFD